MTQEQLTQANKVSNRIAFYTHFDKVLRATGAANIDFSNLKDDIDELGAIRDGLLNIFAERKEAATAEFNKL